MAPTHPPRPTGPYRLLALPQSMVDFRRRGFRLEPAATRGVLERAAQTFLDGFNAELAVRGVPDLSATPPDRRGFAVEGAAMAASMLDAMRPARVLRRAAPYDRRRSGRGLRLAALLDLYGKRYDYLVAVGVGWTMAKLRRRQLGGGDLGTPLVRWLAYDGWGFCQAFFAGERAMRRWEAHPQRCTAVCAIRHQGLGRCLWFRHCGDPYALAAHVSRLPDVHRGDVWSGIALASVYAGGVPVATYHRLRPLAAGHRGPLAQGAAFGAEAWLRSGHLPAAARDGIAVLTGVTPEEAAGWTWQVRRRLDRPDAGPDDYQRWRLGVQQLAGRLGVGG